LCTSCIVNNTIIEGLINAKSIYFLFVIGIILILSPIIYYDYRSKHFFNKLDVAVTIYLFYVIINNFLIRHSFLTKDNAETLALLALYFFSKQIIRENTFLSKIIPIFILGLTSSQILIALLQWFGIIQSYNTSFRFSGFFFNPDPFSIFLSILLCCCLMIALYNSNQIVKFLSITIFFIGLPIIAVSVCRAAWIGLFIGVLFILFQKFKFVQSIIKTRIIRLILILFFCILLPYLLFNLKKASADGRILIYKISFQMIKSHPFFGIGDGGFKSSFLKFQSQYFSTHPQKMLTEGKLADAVWYAFNDFLQITVEHGLIGLFLFSFVLFVCIKYTNDALVSQKIACLHSEAFATGSAACILTIIISGLFSYPLIMLPIKIIFFFCLAILSLNMSAFDLKGITLVFNKLKTVVILICILLGVEFVKYSIELYFAYSLESSLTAFGDNTAILSKLNTRYNIIQNDVWYGLVDCDAIIKTGNYIKAIYELERLEKNSSDVRIYYALGNLYDFEKKSTQAELQYKFLYYALPGLLKPKYMLAMLYHNTGQKAKWNISAIEIINFKPKVRSQETDNMMSHIQQLYYLK
jgi:O-antigen polymerase